MIGFYVKVTVMYAQSILSDGLKVRLNKMPKVIKNKKLTDEEIIKDLTELSRYTGFQEKYIQVLNATLDLINRQKLEIERLKGSTIVNNIMESQRIKREAKAEAYKEFAERIKLSIKANVVETLCNDVRGVYKAEYVLDDIDNLLKELVGEE